MPAEFLPGNRLTLLDSGGEFFPALIAAIDGAQHTVSLQTYIFEDDRSGRSVIEAMKRASARGVVVRVLVDGFGAAHFPDALMPELETAGIQVLIYRREVARFRLRRYRLRRLHRKLAVIDGRIAFVGGINIIDDHNQTPENEWPRKDFAVRVEGPLLAPIQHTVSRLWSVVVRAGLRLQRRADTGDKIQSAPAGTQTAAFVVRDNIRHRRAIEDAYLDAIADARSEIIIACAYFLPGFRFRHALISAAARGATVTVLLQGKIEHALQHYATQALYRQLLSAGIRIFEYQRSYLHAKVAVIDGEWATVGSSNIDPFSLLLAKEANIVVRDRCFAEELRTSLTRVMREDAQELLPATWQQLPWHSRLLRWMSYQLVRLAIGITGYGGKL
ncbi:MAG: cardiolipin synthase [Pseudomonadota bacterium]|nr:cardiolipin synthase [Pseudomonadota bacterium]